jgi:hopene-associated glycosyltransferase HpnB
MVSGKRVLLMSLATLLTFFSLLGWLYLAFFRGRFWWPLTTQAALEPEAWPSVDIIVPARDEAESLPGSLPSLFAQDYPGAWRILLVDDHSSDGTRDTARQLARAKNATERLTIINAPELLPGWNGKLSALQAGVAQSKADYILFTDADILHPPHNLRALVSRATEHKIDLVSQMVKLHCVSFAEKLLIPAFVFFFAALYPFRQVNDPDSPQAAAAGGVMLTKRVMLDTIGGLTSIQSRLIDDCALAEEIKKNGGRIELTLASDVKSLRLYPSIADVKHMIARTAYTQLHHSPLYLAGAIAGLSLLFLAPTLLPIGSEQTAAGMGLLAWAIMTILYLPMVNFYEIPLLWAFMLPAAAVLYMVATIDSARLYWQNKGGQWKGRVQG